MANVLDNTAISYNVYKYKANGYYVLGQEKFPLDYTNFHSIVIDHDYDKNNMPIMYVILNLSTKLIDRIIRNKETGVFIINIQKAVDNSDNPDLWIDYINDTFLYFLADDINKTDARDYENANEGREDVYKEITVGLLCQKLVNNNKKMVNGIIKCNNMASAVAYVAGVNRPLVMEPFENNSPLNSVFLPPRNSVSKSISYLNSIKTFYNSMYRWYMDFDASYLLSSRGRPVPKKGDKINTVMIPLKNDYDSTSKLQGMVIDETNNYYTIEVAATNVEVADYRERSKSYSKVRYTDLEGNNSDYTRQQKKAGENYAAKTKHIRLKNDNVGLALNKEKTTSLFVAVNKTDLDASAFTINKEYILNADEVYAGCDYNGKYLLRRRRELFFKSTGDIADERMTLSTLLYLEKSFFQ